MKQIEKWLSVCLLLFWTLALNAQQNERRAYYTPEDKVIFQRYIDTMQSKRTLPMNELMIQTALFFEGTPYVASTLEKEPEGLVINLRELDCTTFMETVLALCRTLKGDQHTFEAYCDHLQYLRYRHGTITDYTDRLHYIADWFYENERKGIVKDIAQTIGGEPLTLNLSFISTHPDSYKQLKGHPELVQKMEQKEREINQRFPLLPAQGKHQHPLIRYTRWGYPLFCDDSERIGCNSCSLGLLARGRIAFHPRLPISHESDCSETALCKTTRTT